MHITELERTLFEYGGEVSVDWLLLWNYGSQICPMLFGWIYSRDVHGGRLSIPMDIYDPRGKYHYLEDVMNGFFDILVQPKAVWKVHKTEKNWVLSYSLREMIKIRGTSTHNLFIENIGCTLWSAEIVVRIDLSMPYNFY